MVVADHSGDAPEPRVGELQRARDCGAGVEGNARLTGSLAAVIFLLLAAEGFTVLGVHRLLTPHVFIGMLLVPPVLAKIASTTYRFSRYYGGSPPYRRKGPPPIVMRLLGPVVVVLTVAVLASGVALMYVGPASCQTLLFLHKATFVLWFGAIALHVLGHLLDTARLAPADWIRRSRPQVPGAGVRQWVVAVSVVVGLLLGLLVVGQVGPWLSSTPGHLGN